MKQATVFVHLPTPYSTLQLQVSPSASLDELTLPETLTYPLASESAYLRTITSGPLSHETVIADLYDNEDDFTHPIDLHFGVRILGGKGGFGTQLRAAGGRMSMGKSTNMDACRDLSGRRLSTIKEAQRQAELLESAPALRAAAVAADRAKLEALERSLGISAAEGGGGESSKRAADVDVEELARKKHRFDDNQFLEESREIKDNVRSAVSAAMLLKKKKKAKIDSNPPKSSASTSVKAGVEAAKKAEKDKVAMPPPTSTSSGVTALSVA